MPSISTITVNDRQATPVAHTFLPVDVQQPGGVGVLEESSGVLVGANRITLSCRKSNGKLRGRQTMSAPIVQNETINGVTRPVVIRVGYIDLNATFSLDSTLAERNNLLGMFANSLAASVGMTYDTLVKGEAVY